MGVIILMTSDHLAQAIQTYREEILNAYLFSALSEAREITEAWMEEYDAIRPHESLQGLPPYSFVEKNT